VDRSAKAFKEKVMPIIKVEVEVAENKCSDCNFSCDMGIGEGLLCSIFPETLDEGKPCTACISAREREKSCEK
jgi:hypothetical protein